MTTPAIVSVDTFGNNTGNTQAPYTYPTTEDGDLLVLLHANDGGGDDKPSFASTDFTELRSQSQNDHGGGPFGYGAAYLICDGTETGSFNVFHPSTEAWSGLLIRINNWHGTTPPEIGAHSVATTDGTGAVAITPSGWDSSVDDTLFLWYHGTDGTAVVLNTFPPEVADNNQQHSAGTSAPNVAIATDDSATATKNVAAQTSNMSLSVVHGEMLIGIRGVVISDSSGVRKPGFNNDSTFKNERVNRYAQDDGNDVAYRLDLDAGHNLNLNRYT